MKAVEGDTLDESNPCHKPCIVVLLISAVADSQCVVNRQMETINVSAD